MNMRFIALFVSALTLNAASETTASKTWTELEAKRQKLQTIHQELDVSRTFQTTGHSQAMKSQIILDMSQGQWREKSITGSGNRLEIFDGKDLFSLEEGGEEYIRLKRHAKDPDPVPLLYLSGRADWSKSKEIERRPCGLSGKDDQCVVLEVRLKPWNQSLTTGKVSSMIDGNARILVDTENGLVLSLHTVETIQGARGPFQSDVSYGTKRFTYGAAADASLFKLPSEDMREVKELSRWDAAKIKKQLAGKPAPELNVMDIQGKPAALSSFKGKTVLLDFWTTWCPPCRADAPALDKLYRKYAEQDLMIVGISVSEDRAIVEKFLKEHPHSFPVVLSTENEMPAAYQIGVFPTYIVISPDGSIASAAQGDQGFSDLRKMLKKAGLEVD
jgi:thiol-disulfide isomerase/thioredoxin